MNDIVLYTTHCPKCNILKQNLDSYNSFLANKPTFDDLIESGKLTDQDQTRWNESLKRREEGIEMLRNEVNRLGAKDTEYFQRLIEENEAYSISNLKSIM